MALNSEPVTYQSGDLAGSAMQCVDVTIINEDIVESNETFNVMLSSDDPGVEISGMLDQAVATITNDDRKLTFTVPQSYMANHAVIDYKNVSDLHYVHNQYTIIDPATGLSVSWEQEEYMFSESSDPQMVCAVITAGSLEIGVSVAVEAENGTALAGMCRQSLF